MLKEKATAIWNKLGDNDRSNSATTIAVVQCTNNLCYCTSNDVSSISIAASNEALAQGISKTGTEYISKSGAGFHAEMWAVLMAIDSEGSIGKAKNVIKKVGASRACCKNCTAVLDLAGITIEERSDTEYNSWYNPITIGDNCKARNDFQDNQRKNIPDFRNHAGDYWFTPGGEGKTYQKTAPDSAK